MSETQELYLTEPHTRLCTAKVIAADGLGIRLDRTIFHPAGDGIPGDTGLLEPYEAGNDIVIVDTRRGDDGAILHISQPGTAVPDPGLRVNMALNWQRRLRLMRLHTALHVVSALVGGTPVGTSEVHEHGAWLDFDLARTLPDLAELQREFDRIVQANSPVAVRTVERDALDAYSGRLAAPPAPGPGAVTLVEIQGVDVQACGGVHCERTGELAKVELQRIERLTMAQYRVDLRLVD